MNRKTNIFLRENRALFNTNFICRKRLQKLTTLLSFSIYILMVETVYKMISKLKTERDQREGGFRGGEGWDLPDIPFFLFLMFANV